MVAGLAVAQANILRSRARTTTAADLAPDSDERLRSDGRVSPFANESAGEAAIQCIRSSLRRKV